MKYAWVTILLMSFALAAQAAEVSASTGQKNFETFSSLLSQDVDSAERSLRTYMEDSIGCSKVRLNLDILKEEGLFHKGIFNLNLTADCDASISDLRIDFDPLCSRQNNGEAALLLQYVKAGQSVSKRFIVPNSQSCQE